MEYDAQGKLWGVNGGLYLLDLEERYISEINLQSADGMMPGTFGINKDSKGNLWIGLARRIGIMDPAQKSIRFLGAPEGITLQTAYAFSEDQKAMSGFQLFLRERFPLICKTELLTNWGRNRGILAEPLKCCRMKRSAFGLFQRIRLEFLIRKKL